MPFSPTLPDRPSLTEVRSALVEAGDYLNGLRAVPDADRGESWRTDVRSTTDVVHLLDGLEASLAAQSEPVAVLGQSEGRSLATVGDEVVGSDRYTEARDAHRFGSTHIEIELRGSLGQQRDFRALVDTADEALPWLTHAQTALPPVVRQRRLFIRDLMTVLPTTLSSIPYIRENHADEDGAAFTAEGGTKSEVAMDWSQDDAIVRKVTAWLPVTTEVIEDAPTLRGYIDTRLAYLAAVQEEEAIIAGDGIAPNLKGILNFAGLQSQAFVAHPDAASVPDLTVMGANAIAKIENVDGEADAVVMRPTDYWTGVAQRATLRVDGGEGGVGGVPIQFSSAAAAGVPLWGLPVIRSRSCPAGKAVVGAWRMGATLFDRMQTTIRVGNQHSTYFVENKVAVLAESRLALAVHRPDYFVELDLTV